MEPRAKVLGMNPTGVAIQLSRTIGLYPQTSTLVMDQTLDLWHLVTHTQTTAGVPTAV